jgi:tetratricopeptide (TPR) repeat protein
MKKTLLFIWFVYGSGLLASEAQQVEFISHTMSLSAKNDSSIKKAIVSKQQRNVNLPMYGLDNNIQITPNDEAFFLDCEKNFASRNEASLFFSARAWEYLAEGQIDTAMHRFNLAWLLDKQSTDSYWGWGVLAYQKDKLPEAITYLEKGLALKPSNITLMVDLATVYIRSYQNNNNQEELQKSFSLLNKAIEIEPTFANAYMKLSLAEYFKGEFDKAWWSFHKGYDLAPDETDIEYLKQLLVKKEDPKGFFKE